MTELSSEQVANRLTVWARGELAATERPGVVFGTVESMAWLADPAAGIVGPNTLVLIRSRKGKVEHVGPVGQWLGYRGRLDEPGDEIQIGTELWLQTIDYYSTRIMAVAGPTVVRFADAEDASLFVKDAADISHRGYFEPGVLHGAVEIGDRCLISGHLCTRGGAISRLYVGDDGIARTAPGGHPLGRIGDTLPDLATTGARLAEEGVEACAPNAIAEVISQASVRDRLVFVNAVDAIRTMTMRTGRAWNVSGINGRVAADDPAGTDLAPRPDLLLLWSGAEHVLFDSTQRRAFALSPVLAEILDVLLHAASDEDSVDRLAGRAAVNGDPAGAVAAVHQTLAAYGVELSRS